MDQFDEFLYQSKHIGGSNGCMATSGGAYEPPEVNIGMYQYAQSTHATIRSALTQPLAPL
jgi:hypothetical protein